MEIQWEAIETEEKFQLGFSDIVGKDIWVRYFTKLLERKTERPKKNTYLLLGERGNGKKTLAKAIAGEAVKRGYSCHSLYMDELPQGDIERVKHWFKSFCKPITSKEHLLLLFSVDKIQKKKLNWLLSTVFAQLRSAFPEMIIIATAENIDKVPERITAFAEICPINSPKKQDAVIVFKKLLSPVGLEETISDAIIENKLEGCSMLQIERITVLAKHLLYLYRMEYQDEKEDEIEIGIKNGHIRLSLELLEKTISEIDSLGYNRQAKGKLFVPTYEVVRQNGQTIPAETMSQAPQKNKEKATVSIIEESMEKIDDADVQNGIAKAMATINEEEPSYESLEQTLKERGMHSEKIELGDVIESDSDDDFELDEMELDDQTEPEFN